MALNSRRLPFSSTPPKRGESGCDAGALRIIGLRAVLLPPRTLAVQICSTTYRLFPTDGDGNGTTPPATLSHTLPPTRAGIFLPFSR